MLVKKIKYIDFDGNEREETHYFNLSKAELMEMELSTSGGLEATINQIINQRDNKRIVELFKDLILKSYGVKSPDGKRFEKSQAIRDEFVQTNAYSELFMELATDEKKASDFVNGIIDASLAGEMKKKNETEGLQLVDKKN